MTYDKATVKDAPNVSADEHLSPEEEQQLYRYYNLDNAGKVAASGTDTGVAHNGQDSAADCDGRDLAGEPGVQGRDASGRLRTHRRLERLTADR